MKTKEKRYIIGLTLSLIALIAAYVISFAYGIRVVDKTDTWGTNFFEIVYFAFHFIFLVLSLSFCIAALRGHSYKIIKSLMFVRDLEIPSIPARIIASCLAGTFFLVGIYSFLLVCHVNLPNMDFPIFLRLVLVNVSFYIFDVALFFVFYPFVYKK